MRAGWMGKLMKDSNQKQYLPFLVLALAALLAHFLFPLNWSDDAIFAQKAADAGLLQFLNGSARPLTDGLTYIFARWPLLWRFCNPIMLTMLARILSKLFPWKNPRQANAILCCTVAYPALVLADAGFIATTVNYLWPVTCGLLCLFPLRNACIGRRTPWYIQVLLLPPLLYAGNMQQMCVLLLVVLLGGCIYLLIHKHRPLYIMLQLALCVVGVLCSYYLNLLGENARMLRETQRYFPAFAKLNLLERLELGFSSTFYCMTMELRLAWVAFLAFTLLLAAAVWRRSKQKHARLFGLVPLAFTGICGGLSLVSTQLGPVWDFLSGGLRHYRTGQASYTPAIVPDIFFLLVCLCVLYGLCVIFKQKWDVISAVAILILGLGTRVMMGFSPTVWASGYRTFFILILALIIVAIQIVAVGWKREEDLQIKEGI